MSKQQLTRNILCAVLAASTISFSGTVLAADKVEIGPVYGYADLKDSIIVADDYDINDAEGQSAIDLESPGNKLTTDNVDVKSGSINVENGSELHMKNGTIYASPYYVNGKAISDNGLSVNNGSATFDNMTMNGSIAVGSFNEEDHDGPSTAVFNNSNIDANTPYGHGTIMAGLDGKITLNGGTYKTDEFIGSFHDGSIEINGGTLVADNLRAVTNGSLLKATSTTNEGGLTQSDINYIKSNIKKGGIVLQNNGVIETKTGQIFEHGIDTTSNETVVASKDSGKVTNDYIKYDGGTLNFTDTKYSQAYLDSAKSNMANAGKTNINMLGTLVDENGEVIKDITVDEAVNNENIHINAAVNTEADISHLVVGNGTTDSTTQYSNGSFVASKLKLGENTNKISITNGHSLGLGGTGGDLVTGNKGDLSVTVNEGATLNIGRTGVTTTDSSNTLSANVESSGTINTQAGQNTVKGNLTMNSTAALNITGNSSLDVTGTLSTGNAQINIGDKDSAGKLTANDAQLQGSNVYLDPVWKNGQTIGDGSKAALKLKEDKVDGNFVVGEHSTLTLGSTDTTLAENAFAKTGLTWGSGDNDVLSAVYIATPQNIANGSIIADKTATNETTANAGDLKFATNSILMVDGSQLDDTTVAISGANGNIEIAQNSEENKQDGAKLYIDNAKSGQSYTILSGTGVEETDKWADDNVIADNVLLKFTSDETIPSKYTAEYQNVNKVLNNSVVIGDLVDGTLQAEKTANNEAYDFFNNAASDHYNTTKSAKASAFNSAANLGELGGVNHATYSMSNMLTDSVANHLSIASHDYAENDIWAKYIHSKEDISDVKLGGLDADYDASFNGFIVGGDFYNNGKTTAGLAFSYANGSITGNTLASRTKNDSDYYGLSLYGRIDNGDSALLGDISYLHSSNDITQYNSGYKLTASPDADAFSIGIRAEKLLGTDSSKFVPYIGLRYMHLGVSDYTNNIGMKYDADDQNLFLLPIGISYSGETKHGNWTVRPTAEVGYVWTMGDRDTDQTVSLNGVSDTFGFNTTDDGSFIGKLGIEMENDNVAYGIGYEYQKGDTVKSNRWMASATFKF